MIGARPHAMRNLTTSERSVIVIQLVVGALLIAAVAAFFYFESAAARDLSYPTLNFDLASTSVSSMPPVVG